MKCKCGSYIHVHANFNDIAECCGCYRKYILRNGRWKELSQNEFRRIYTIKLIKQQESNRGEK